MAKNNIILEKVLKRIISEGLMSLYGEKLDLSLGDVISIKKEDTFTKSYNKGLENSKSLVGREFEVINMHPLEGDDREDALMFCEGKDRISGKKIRYIPCYSNMISIVERKKQLIDLKVGDVVYVIDIQENYFKVKNIQEKLGTAYRISKIRNMNYLKDSRLAFVVPEDCDYDDYSEMLVVPLTEDYVETN